MKLAYLIGRYPAVTHTFIAREIVALRARGVEIDTISVHATPSSEMRTAEERAERDRTFTVLPTSARALVGAHLRALLHSPTRYVATAILALRLAPGGAKSRLWQLFYFMEAMIVWRHCRDRRIRHLHAQFTSQVTDIALLIAHFEKGGRRSTTWSFTVHGPDEFYEVTRFNLAEKVRRATFVVCISDFARSQLMALVPESHWDKLVVVHCGLDPDEFRPADPPEPAPELRILCIGRLVPVKGQELLLRAAHRLVRRGFSPRITLVGGGPTQPRLERLAAETGLSEHLVFAGFVGQDEIRALYGAADVFVLPSFAEGVPVVLMEAMAMGLPVVTSRIMGIPELVDHETSGLLIAPGNEDELTRALERLAEDPDLRKNLGRAAREKVRAEFSIGDSAAQLHAIFAERAAAG